MSKDSYEEMVAAAGIAARAKPSFKNACLASVATSFQENIRRVENLLEVPFRVALETSLYANALCHAHAKVFGTLSPKPDQYAAKGKDVAALMQVLWVGARTQANQSRQVRSKEGRAFTDEERQHGAGYLKILAQDSPPMTEGVDAVFSAAILGQWTAIETMCGDLWEAAVNWHPKGLSNLSHQAKRIIKKASTRTEKELNKKKSKSQVSATVRLGSLERYSRGTFDLSQSMGTLLRAKLHFTSLSSIRQAYGRTFPPTDPIDEALASNALDALSVTRNVIVHRGGRADDEYVANAKAIPLAPRVAKGEQIPIHGEWIAPILNASGLLPLS